MKLMKMVVHHRTPVPPEDYEGLASLLRTTFDGKPVVEKKCIKEILKDDPEFAKWFKSHKSK